MKTLLQTIIFLLITLTLSAQSNYNEAIQMGDAALKNNQFRVAIRKYLAADAFNIKNDPDKKEQTQQRINNAFEKIEKMKDDAETAQKQAENALKEVEKQKENAEQMRKNTVELLYILKPQNITNMFDYFSQLADKYMARGIYNLALDNYKLAGFSPEIDDADQLLKQKNIARKCYVLANSADSAFNLRHWHEADSLYNKILLFNAIDENALNKRMKIELLLQNQKVKITPFKTIDWSRIKYAKCVEREVVLNEKENLPLYLPEKTTLGYSNLITYLLAQVNDRKLIAYKYESQSIFYYDSTYWNKGELDWYTSVNFDNITPLADIEERLDIKNVTYLSEDPQTGKTIQTIIKPEFKSTEITKYIVSELWLYNSNNQVEDTRVIGFMPIRRFYKPDDFAGANPLYRSVMTIFYPQCRYLLAKQPLANSETTYDDYFFNRDYKGEIKNQYPLSFSKAFQFVEPQKKDSVPFLTARISPRKLDKSQITSARYIYRRIVANDSCNRPIFLPVKKTAGYKKLMDILFYEIANNTITYYSPDNSGSNKDFVTPMNFVELKENFGAKESVQMVEDVMTGQMVEKKLNSDLNTNDVQEYIVKEVWLYNAENELEDIEVIGICPIRIFYKDDDIDMVKAYRKSICWIRYADVAKTLGKHEVFNTTYSDFTVYNDFFAGLKYNGVIEDEMNVSVNQAFDELQKLYAALPSVSNIQNTELPALLRCNKLCSKAVALKNRNESEPIFKQLQKEYKYTDIQRFIILNDINLYLPELTYYFGNQEFNDILKNGGSFNLTNLKNIIPSRALMAFRNVISPVRVICTNKRNYYATSIIDTNDYCSKGTICIKVFTDSYKLEKIIRTDDCKFLTYDFLGLALSPTSKNRNTPYVIDRIEVDTVYNNFLADIEKFKEIEYLNISHFDSSKMIAEKLYDHKNLKTIILARDVEFPEGISSLKNLETLIILGNKHITSFPKDFIKCQNLKKIELAAVHFRQFPEEILKMKNLTSLTINNCFFDKNNSDVYSLRKLTNLDSLVITHFPVSLVDIESLKLLKHLILKDYSMNSIPISFAKIPLLQTIDLSSNNINSLPSEIVKLTQLTTLIINSNPIKELPHEIGNLLNLKLLDISNTKISNLPDEITNLKNLQYIYIGNTPNIKTLQDKIQKWLPKCTIY